MLLYISRNHESMFIYKDLTILFMKGQAIRILSFVIQEAKLRMLSHSYLKF